MKYYFNVTDPNGASFYYQLRYFTPYDSEECYDGLIISVKNGKAEQTARRFNENDFRNMQRFFSAISPWEFEHIQVSTGLLAKSRSAYSNLYYDKWRNYYSLKRQAQQAAAAANLTDWWKYSQRLEAEENALNVKEVFADLMTLEHSIRDAGNLSVQDVYSEAKHNATLDYVARRI